jgi:hypothetical protein
MSRDESRAQGAHHPWERWCRWGHAVVRFNAPDTPNPHNHAASAARSGRGAGATCGAEGVISPYSLTAALDAWKIEARP